MGANVSMQVGDVGTVIRLTIEDGGSAVDVSSASTKQIILLSPTQGATALTKTASFTTDGTDGRIEYATVAGDIDVPGWWKVQAKVVLSSGTWSSTPVRFRVRSNLG